MMGLGFLINGKYFRKMIDEMMKCSACMFFGGIMALVVGFLMVTYHNVWVYEWRVIITILGWLGLIKGVMLFLVPKPFMKFSEKIMKMKNLNVVAVGALIFGGILGYFGFFM